MRTLAQFTIGRDERPTGCADHWFIVGQYLRITESNASTGWTTGLASHVGAGFDAASEIRDVVDRHVVLASVWLPYQFGCLDMVP
jgi:hypothetical protein